MPTPRKACSIPTRPSTSNTPCEVWASSTDTSQGVFDPDKTVDFVVPNLHQFLTSQDLDNRLASSEMLIELNEQLRQSGGAQRVRDMAPALKMMVPALQTGDKDTLWRLYDQVQATEFFFDHTDATGTS